MEMGEGHNPPPIEKKPDDPKDKEPLTIRIILMCDGTNNNRANILEREKSERSEVSKSYSDFADVGNGADSSYDNGRTNIAIMEPHIVQGENAGYSMVVKVYVEGQGTLAFHKDDTKGLAFAAGLTGISQRARMGINNALEALYDKLFKIKKPDDYFIQHVDVDVFGFSRGAATARHAIHLITEREVVVVGDPSGYSTQTVVTNQPLYERLMTTYGYREMSANRVKIIFAGLYDTVVSFACSQLAPAWIANNTQDQRGVAKAKFALHLAAADEHRQDFPLHKIQSALDAGTGAEYYFPGAHSDIGGSYNLANEFLLENNMKDAELRELKGMGDIGPLLARKKVLESQGHKVDVEETAWTTVRGGRRFAREGKLYVYRKIKGSEYVRCSDENKVINRGKVSDLKQDMANLIEDGWYINDDPQNPQIWIETNSVATAARALVTPVLWPVLGSPLAGKLFVSRRNITSGYCNIPLKIMAEYSRKYSILVDGKLDQRANIILSEDPQNHFDTLEGILRAYMTMCGLKGSKPSDWTSIVNATYLYPDIKNLRNRHLHMSCRWEATGAKAAMNAVLDAGFTPRFEGNLRRRFYYEG